jgi:hypothetical protein
MSIETSLKILSKILFLTVYKVISRSEYMPLAISAAAQETNIHADIQKEDTFETANYRQGIK